MADQQSKSLFARLWRGVPTKPLPTFQVQIANDETTKAEFVTLVLERVFGMTAEQAQAVVGEIETAGSAAFGTFGYAEAKAKVERVRALSRKLDFPLVCTIEPTEGWRRR